MRSAATWQGWLRPPCTPSKTIAPHANPLTAVIALLTVLKPQKLTDKDPMFYTLGTAAKATGKTKTAIAEAIKKSRLSAVKDELGRYQIDPAELHRVYPPVSKKDGNDDPQQGQDKTLEFTSKIMMLEMQVKAAGELKDQIAAERDDLRAERDHWRRQATALLTSQQEAKATAPPRPWWHRFF